MLSKNLSSFRLRADPQPTTKISKSDRTRAEIMDAALKFIWSRPFHEMTVDSLMTSTGVGRSTFYRYFSDLHGVMKALLDMLEGEISAVVHPWFTGVGDPVALLNDTVAGLVHVCYQRGPFFKAVADAAVIVALKRLNAFTIIEAFGSRPRKKPEPVRVALSRIWISTLYGTEWVDKESSGLVSNDRQTRAF